MTSPVAGVPASFVIPDILSSWPFQRVDNPALALVQSSHRKWFQSLKTNAKYQKTFEGCNAPLLCSIAYPFAPASHVRIGADLLLLEFLIDDIADHLSPGEASRFAGVIRDVLKNPGTKRPDGEDTIGAIVQDFWLRASSEASHTFIWKLRKELIGYVDAICQEGVDRDSGQARDLDSYMQLRKTAIGVLPAISVCLHNIDIPRDVLLDPKILELETLAGRMAFLTNDMTSYNVEQARGDDLLNSVALLIRTEKMPVQDAFDAVADKFRIYTHEFLAIMRTLPLDSDPSLKAYVHCMGYWVTAAHEWAFEVGRYRLNSAARSGGRVFLLPKKIKDEA
ncbi:uncharacterized protein PAC_16221 [Phialocephala subalpina]|uniref:Terpene synthase n=1 Tax=Phialocephala subalpina TaxID=576137 RepID=A0A1L7XMN9_9HELO|nr:uncharacterized protein PAC_16221 [Phialocephala subalpina]